jgi:hypothetical protein
MNADDIEDMLFGLDASQDYPDDATDDSEDEMLGAVDDEELTLWDVENSPLLMPATTDHEVEEHISLDIRETRMRQKADSVRPLRDR